MKLQKFLVTGLCGAMVGGVVGLAIWAASALLEEYEAETSIVNMAAGSSSTKGDLLYPILDIIRRFPDEESEAIERLVLAQIVTGDIEGASATLDNVEAGSLKSTILYRLLIVKGDRPLRSRIVEVVESQIPKESTVQRRDLLTQLGVVQIEEQDLEAARSTLREASATQEKLQDAQGSVQPGADPLFRIEGPTIMPQRQHGEDACRTFMPIT